MVYLSSVIAEKRKQMVNTNSIQAMWYYYCCDPEMLNHQYPDLSIEESIALQGYIGGDVDSAELDRIVNKPVVKGINYATNVYKLCGLYLANNNKFAEEVKAKFDEGSAKTKYLISLIERSYTDDVKQYVANAKEPDAILIKKILEPNSVTDCSAELQQLITNSSDAIDILILERVEKALLQTTVVDLSSEEVIRQVLTEFGNSVKKVSQPRRKGHQSYEINDEYDVQDILYVMLKGIFPKLKEEDPVPRVGLASTRIDLIIREEATLIEVKMIKNSDSNEKKFIDELKIDIQSYYQSQWMKKLFCFVYDPQKKTKDLQNFYNLNGKQTIDGKEFDVEVIVVS